MDNIGESLGLIGELVQYIKQLIEELVAIIRGYNDAH